MTHYRRQAAVCAEGGDVFQETGALYNAALMAQRLAQTPADLERIEAAEIEALDAAVRAGNRDTEARLRLLLAQPFDGNPQRRREALKALAAARAISSSDLELQAIRGLALHDLAVNGSAASDALATIRETVERAQAFGDLYQEIASRMVLASALWSYGDRNEALAESLAALESIDELRILQTADEERARIASTWSHAFYRVIGRLLETGDAGDLQLGLQVMERLRAHSLIDLLEAADAQTPEVVEAEAITIEAVQAALKADEVLVSFQLADRIDLSGRWQGGSWLILITSQNVAAHALPDRREIEAAVDIYLGLVRQGNDREADAAHKLFELVPCAGIRGIERGRHIAGGDSRRRSRGAAVCRVASRG